MPKTTEKQRIPFMGGWVEIMGPETPSFEDNGWTIRLIGAIHASSFKEKANGEKLMAELGFKKMVNDPDRYQRIFEMTIAEQTMAEAIANIDLKRTFNEIIQNS